MAVEMQIEITSSPELFVCTAYYYMYYTIKRVGLLWESVWRRAGLSRLPWTSLIGRWCWGRPMRAQVNPDTSTHTLGVPSRRTPRVCVEVSGLTWALICLPQPQRPIRLIQVRRLKPALLHTHCHNKPTRLIVYYI